MCVASLNVRLNNVNGIERVKVDKGAIQVNREMGTCETRITTLNKV